MRIPDFSTGRPVARSKWKTPEPSRLLRLFAQSVFVRGSTFMLDDFALVDAAQVEFARPRVEGQSFRDEIVLGDRECDLAAAHRRAGLAGALDEWLELRQSGHGLETTVELRIVLRVERSSFLHPVQRLLPVARDRVLARDLEHHDARFGDGREQFLQFSRRLRQYGRGGKRKTASESHNMRAPASGSIDHAHRRPAPPVVRSRRQAGGTGLEPCPTQSGPCTSPAPR